MSDDASKEPESGKDTAKVESPNFEGPDAPTNELRADDLPDTQTNEAIEGPDSTSEVSQADSDADGTVELDSRDIEAIDPEAIQPLEEGPSQHDSDSTQVLERDRLQRQVEKDQADKAASQTPQGEPKTTQEMKPVEESTTAFKIPSELIAQTRDGTDSPSAAQDGPATEKMTAIDGLNATSEFDADFDDWLDVGEDGTLHFVARVDDDGALIVPRGLLDDDLLPAGSVLVIDAQIIEPDE